MKLELLEIPEPCSVPWEGMTGDERVRHCLHCHLDVYDLSALTREEAERLLETREGLCVTLLKRHDGTVVTQDCAPQRAPAPHACDAPSASLASRSPPPPAPPSPAPAPSAPPAAAPSGAVAKPPAAPRPAPAPRAPAPSAPRPVAPPTPPPPVRLGGAPMPTPTPAVWEPADPRVGRGTLLADFVRAIRAVLPPEEAEARVRDVERALEFPANWRTAACQRTKCPLWIPGGSDPVPADFLKPRAELLAFLEPVTRAAFAADRADSLLREVRRTAFAGSRGSCPHCHAWISLPPAPPPVSPG